MGTWNEDERDPKVMCAEFRSVEGVRNSDACVRRGRRTIHMQLNLQSGLGSRGTGTSGADTGTGIGDPDTDTAARQEREFEYHKHTLMIELENNAYCMRQQRRSLRKRAS